MSNCNMNPASELLLSPCTEKKTTLQEKLSDFASTASLSARSAFVPQTSCASLRRPVPQDRPGDERIPDFMAVLGTEAHVASLCDYISDGGSSNGKF